MGTLYENIISLCQDRGIKGGKMCTDLGISKGLLTDLKMGRRSGISAKTADKIASYFGVSVGYLLGTEQEKKLVNMEHLKELRLEKGVSQQIVADYLEITRQAYSNYENGNREPDYETLLKLAEYFGTTVDTILRGKEKNLVNNDEELTEYLEELRSRPDKRMLFSVTKNATKAQIEAIVRMIEEMQGYWGT